MIKINNRKLKIMHVKRKVCQTAGVSFSPIKKNFLLPIFIILIVILSINFILAYQRLCLKYGQSVPNATNPRYTCYHDTCQICVDSNNYPTHPNRCNDIPGCQIFGDAEPDITPPNFTIISPENTVYNSRMVLIELESIEPASFYYRINNIGVWKRLVSLTKSYSKEISFKDGLNNVSFKAVDRNSNSMEKSVSFYVDSIKPKITSTLPKKGFANGDFEINFIESNPENLVLHYGVEDFEITNFSVDGFKETEINLSDCHYFDSGKVHCPVSVSVDEFDGQEIEYWFELTDIAENVVESKHLKLKVDVSPPVIVNSDFWSQTNNIINFDIEINESNLAHVSYIDNGMKEKKLCTKLKNGKCEKKVKFKPGHHILDIIIEDLAGNSLIERIEFDV